MLIAAPPATAPPACGTLVLTPDTAVRDDLVPIPVRIWSDADAVLVFCNPSC